MRVVKVFISWSGPRSKLLADALREWIHDVIQSVECFCSTEDIRAGQRWNNEVNGWLANTDFGILCVTPENARAPWLNFEAGALAKRISDDARVVPVTLGFQPSALEEPLKQFNGVMADRPGLLKLMKSISEIADPAIDIDRAFGRWWSDIEEKLASIPDQESKVATPEPPDVTELFSDIMASIRGLTGEIRHSYTAPRNAPANYEDAAILLARDPALREDVANGNVSAIRYLREESRRFARSRIQSKRHVEELRTGISDGNASGAQRVDDQKDEVATEA